MDKFFASLSRGALATLAIVAGIVFIILNDPPKTVCDAQTDLFREEESGFLFIPPTEKFRKEPAFVEDLQRCKLANAPGGCYELFAKLKHMIRSIEVVPRECLSTVTELPAVRQAIWESLNLFVQIAWGSQPPDSYFQKFGWLDPSDMHTYCRLRSIAIDAYGEPAWESFRERHFQELPGAKTLSRKEVWDKMILSVNCAQYK